MERAHLRSCHLGEGSLLLSSPGALLVRSSRASIADRTSCLLIKKWTNLTRISCPSWYGSSPHLLARYYLQYIFCIIGTRTQDLPALTAGEVFCLQVKVPMPWMLPHLSQVPTPLILGIGGDKVRGFGRNVRVRRFYRLAVTENICCDVFERWGKNFRTSSAYTHPKYVSSNF